MTKPKLLLHIGLPKTGTTFIQSNLLQHREQLLNRGLLYPLAGLHGVGHAAFAREFIEENLKQRFAQENIFNAPSDPYRIRDDILYEIGRSEIEVQRIVISSEAFTNCDALGTRRLHELLSEYFTISILLFLRRQDHYAESCRAQAYRVHDTTMGPVKLVAPGSPVLDFESILANWESAFGKQNIRVKEFSNRIDLKQTLYSEFSFPTDIPLDEGVVNPSLGRDLLEFIHFYTELVFGTDLYFTVLDKLIEVEQQTPSDRRYKNFYSPQLRQQLVERYAAMNQRIGERYGLPLFASLESKVADPNWQSYPGLPERKRVLFERVMREYAPHQLVDDAPIDRGYEI